MDKKYSYIIIVILIAFSVWMFADGIELQSKSQVVNSASSAKTNSFSGTKVNLSAVVEKEYEPNLVLINLGVETEKEKLETAFEINNEKMNAVTENIKKLEIISLETSHFNIHSRRRSLDDNYKIYYRVSNQIQVKTDKINQVGQIIQTAVKAGANQINSINYQLENQFQYKKEVTRAALDKLNEKIKYTADNIDKREYELKNLNINDRYISGRGNLNYEVKTMGAESSIIPPISPENIKIRIEVHGTYNLSD